ncbi:MAG: helix-turn-helix domain-containing protein [Lachnospiraceae bacterium]|nr:helix-turn-helix domain-containing protein [Lachnospiraceae bacterium]
MEIKEIREILGDNITEFSKRYNIPYPTILKWERGERRPPEWVLSLLERVAREDAN